MGREVGGGIGMGKTCEPKAFSFQCMTEFTTKKKEYWSGLPFASPEGLPNPGNQPSSPALRADSSPSSHGGSHGKAVWRNSLSLPFLFLMLTIFSVFIEFVKQYSFCFIFLFFWL